MKNAALKTELSGLSAEDFQSLRENFYKISDGLMGIELDGVDVEGRPELAKQIELLEKVQELFDKSDLGSVL